PAVRGRKGIYTELFRTARKLGFARARVDGVVHTLNPPPSLARYKEHNIDIVIGTLSVTRGGAAQLPELVATALRFGSGALIVANETVDDPDGERTFSERLYCARCGIGYEALDPRLFSFNSRQGACPDCDGIGSVPRFDADLLIHDPQQPVGAALADVLKPL